MSKVNDLLVVKDIKLKIGLLSVCFSWLAKGKSIYTVIVDTASSDDNHR